MVFPREEFRLAMVLGVKGSGGSPVFFASEPFTPREQRGGSDGVAWAKQSLSGNTKEKWSGLYSGQIRGSLRT